MRFGPIFIAAVCTAGLGLAGCASGDAPASQDAAASSADGCAVATPEVEIVISPAGPTEDRRHSIAELSRWMLESGDREIDADDAIFGMTESVVKGQVIISGYVRPAGHAACAQATKVTARVNWSINVHLGTELIPGSCSYLAVQRHESKHVAVDIGLRPVLKDRLQTVLGAAASQPGQGADGKQARAALQAQVDAAFDTVLKKLMADRHELHQQIDTPAEHAHVLASCPADEFRAAARGGTAS